MSVAEKIYAELFPNRLDETGKITKKIADIIAAEIAAEAKERDALVEAAQESLRMMESSIYTCTAIERRLRAALKPFTAAKAGEARVE